MLRKIHFVSTILGLAMFLLVSSSSSAQESRPAPSPMPTAAPTTSGGTVPQPRLTAEGLRPTAGVISQQRADWDGKSYPKVIVTPLKFKFSSAADYDNFAAGKLQINLLLKNPSAGQTITIPSRLLAEGFTRAASKDEITVYVVIDNVPAPLGDWERCIDTKVTADRSVNISVNGSYDVSLSYNACGSSTSSGNGSLAQRPGQPIKGIIVHGGKASAEQPTAAAGSFGPIVLGGAITVAAPGHSEVTTREAAASIARGPNVIVIGSSKGSGSPKQCGFCGPGEK
jgi:hypothetical protein